MLWIDTKYINLISNKLERFTKKSDNLYNFRCPYCGDSQRNKFKARGYVYELKGNLLYKCHNCSQGGNLGSLLEFVDQFLFNQYRLEKFKEKGHRTPANTVSKFIYKPNFDTNPLKDVKRVTELEFEHNAVQYLIKRQVPSKVFQDLFYIDNIQELEKIFPDYEGRLLGEEERILIPCYTRQKKLIGLTCRGINNERLRYVTIKVNKDHPLVFGLDKVNINKTVYVLEGPIDSMFINNSISVGGSDFKRISNITTKENFVMVYDNQPRNIQLVNTMQEMINKGYRVVIWPDFIKEKDINEMILAGKTVDEVLQIINENACSTLKANLRLKEWRKINAV